MFMCRYCNTITIHHASESLCGECVWVSKWAAQLKTILVGEMGSSCFEMGKVAETGRNNINSAVLRFCNAE